MGWFLELAVLCLFAVSCKGDVEGELRGSDSLRGALNAINRRQRDLSDPNVYYLHPHMYSSRGDGDGQPEDIGYGYQKSLAPKTAGVFEAIPLPESELGSHDPGVESYFPEGKALENIIIDYIEDNMENSIGIEPAQYHHKTNPNLKRSVFRERDIHELPDALQNLYLDNDNSNQFYENGDHSIGARPSKIPMSYSQNVQPLVRSFGGLDRDTDSFPHNDDDPNEYLSVLNSVWEKYQDSNPEHFDPEELTESDTENILSYLNQKVNKRQYENNYENVYDVFNTPLVWVKKDRLLDKPAQHQYLHALKISNSPIDNVQSYKGEGQLDKDKVEDVKLLMEDQISSRHDRRYKKRFWRGNTYDERMTVSKRYPIAKRSSYYTNPAVLYHQTSADKFNERKKKNINSHTLDETTDPKVAMELSDIFSAPKNSTNLKEYQNASNSTKTNQVSSDKLPKTEFVHKSHNHSKTSLESTDYDTDGSHNSKEKLGQKEESGNEFQTKPLGKSKKSINWSNYFGIDKRHKKSKIQPASDEWLLDQYLKAYSISAKAFKDPSANQAENPEVEVNRKGSDDMDAKLRAMEDIIVDQALKYTGAHEGITNLEEVQAVKDKVIAQLAAAYSLEKMRKALSEFKYSIAAQKTSSPTHATTHAPTELPDQKNKRVAVKKENAVIPQDDKLEKKEDLDNTINVFHSAGNYHPTSWNQDGSCPILEDIDQQCKVISNIAGDRSDALVPLCILHQVCYLCGSEIGELTSGCDTHFLSEANKMCGDNGRCQYSVHRAMAALRSGSVPRTCDWQGYPCLARYLAHAMR